MHGWQQNKQVEQGNFLPYCRLINLSVRFFPFREVTPSHRCPEFYLVYILTIIGSRGGLGLLDIER